MVTLRFLKLVLASVVAGLALQQVAPQAMAQAFPSKLVHITSAYSTGTGPDITARIVADKLARYWNQQVILESRPGANGLIAIGATKKASADGHELLLLGGGMLTIAPSLVKNLPYDPVNDFVPVSLIFRAPFFLVVSSSGPFKSMQDLIAAARANPGKVSYGSTFVGDPPHLAGALLAHLTGTKMLVVPFKESVQLNTAIVNGDISFSFWILGSVLPLVKAGKLKLLALAASSRTASEPDVPTLSETDGLAGFEIASWTALVAPRGTPPEVAQRISADVAKALSEPDVKERFRGLGLDPAPTTPAEMARIVRSGLEQYADIIKRTGITSE